MTLSRNKSSSQGNHSAGPMLNTNFQECGDCSSPNANWASLNHGVLICDECCLAHRSLGRCISIIKSLRKSYWPQSLIDTLYDLVRSNSNHIWEANLGNEGQNAKQMIVKNSKKNSSKDLRLNFIRTKYENLAYISRGKYTSIEELNQQLLSSVKTNNFEKTLRILSQGADANYRSQEDGLLCLHVAVLNNQLGQIELLCLYGADVTGLDRHGNTPVELARASNMTGIADRLIELQFELTDELTYFLCNKRPDHKSFEHYMIPSMSEQYATHGDQMQNINFKLQELPDHLFEELAKDIYDELDRRQIETIWKCTVPQALVNEPIPFLVIKSCFTQTRNQLRQKLARFNAAEFSMLLVEILSESKRRYSQLDTSKSEQTAKESDDLLEEDDPLYDKVPSDEDYASVASESGSSILESKQKKSKSKYMSSVVDQYDRSSPDNPKSTRSNMANTPSPSNSKLKVLTTNFDKPNFNNSGQAIQPAPHNPASTLVANAESALNSIMNSLNQIDYSHLNQPSPYQQQVGSPSPKQPTDLYSRDRLNRVADVKGDMNELKEENSLMQAMIERLMEENAQLRAEKMLITSNPSASSVVNNVSLNMNNVFYNPSGMPDELGLYSTVKNKKFNMLKDHMNTANSDHSSNVNVHNLKLNSFSSQEDSASENGNLNTKTDSPTHKSSKNNQLSKKVYLTIENSSDSSNDFNNMASKSTKSNMSCISDNMFDCLKIVEEKCQENSESSPSKSSYQSAKKQILLKQERANSFNNIKASPKHGENSPHSKLSPSKSMTMAAAYCNTITSASNNLKQQNLSHPELDFIGAKMPSKDAVIRKMKKITKAVQELFKATKESDFVLFKGLCEKVNRSVNEMIALFPEQINSEPIEENLNKLIENSENLMNLIQKYNSEIDTFSSNEYEDEENTEVTKANNNGQPKPILSTSSSSSSAISSGSELPNHMQQHMKQDGQQESPMLKNMIVSNLVTYSYEIAFTVKRIVCIMGAEHC